MLTLFIQQFMYFFKKIHLYVYEEVKCIKLLFYVKNTILSILGGGGRFWAKKGQKRQKRQKWAKMAIFGPFLAEIPP